jgi:HEAT repeat protein
LYLFQQIQSNTDTKSIDTDLIVENLLKGIESENLGLKTSATIQLGNYDSPKSVIPLLKALKTDNNESVRISAAISLYKLGNPRGVFAVKRAAKFKESERVRKICAKLYNQYKLDQNS